MPLAREKRWFAAPAVYALNNIVGYRLLPTVFEHLKASTSNKKVHLAVTMAHFFMDCGIFRAPLVDKRAHPNVRTGNEAWVQPAITYVRPDGREFRCRMSLAR